MSQETDQPPYIDRPEMPATYADLVRLIHFDGYLFHIELVARRPTALPDNKTSLTLSPAARLVMPPGAAAELHAQLGNIIAQLEQKGVLKRVMPEPNKKQ